MFSQFSQQWLGEESLEIGMKNCQCQALEIKVNE